MFNLDEKDSAIWCNKVAAGEIALSTHNRYSSDSWVMQNVSKDKPAEPAPKELSIRAIWRRAFG